MNKKKHVEYCYKIALDEKHVDNKNYVLSRFFMYYTLLIDFDLI